MKLFYHIFLSFTFTIFIQKINAQVGIGTNQPDASAKLDVNANNKGFLPPRVSLTSTSDITTIASPASGLLVYCTGNGGLTAGYYYWGGASWVSLGGNGNIYSSNGTLNSNRTLSTSNNYTLTVSPKTIFNPTLTASGSAIGVEFNPTLTAAANNDVLVGININPTFTTNAFSGLSTYGLRVQGIDIGKGGGSNLSATAVGTSALKNNWSSGANNTAFGYQALTSNKDGLQNTALGSNAMFSNIGGRYNTAIGNSALYSNINGYYSVAIGNDALYNYTANGFSDFNIGIGYQALKGASAYTGKSNLAIGNDALVGISTGSDNVALGMSSLNGSGMTGCCNVGTGTRSLYKITSGSSNVALGMESLYNLTSGSDNISIGAYSMYTNSSSSHNLAIGRSSLYSNTGTQNVAVGSFTLNGNIGGGQNTAVGYDALKFNTTGSFNTAIGTSSGPTSASLTNTTAIGYGAVPATSNTVQIGNGSVTTITGAVNFTAASDRRLKESITETKYGLKDVLKLRPVDYKLKSSQLKQVGFIAQEVKIIIPEIVTGKEGDLSKGETLGITYGNLVPILTKAIQEQESAINLLKKEVEELKYMIKMSMGKK